MVSAFVEINLGALGQDADGPQFGTDPTPEPEPGGGDYIYADLAGQSPGDAMTVNGGADKILSPS